MPKQRGSAGSRGPHQEASPTAGGRGGKQQFLFEMLQVKIFKNCCYGQRTHLSQKLRSESGRFTGCVLVEYGERLSQRSQGFLDSVGKSEAGEENRQDGD